MFYYKHLNCFIRNFDLILKLIIVFIKLLFIYKLLMKIDY